MGIVMVGFISDSPSVNKKETVVIVDSLVFKPLALPDKKLTNELISFQTNSSVLKRELQNFKTLKAKEDSLKAEETYITHR